MKMCIDCGQEKQLIEYYKDRNRYSAHCKKCQHERQRLSRQRQKQKLIKEFGGKCIKCGYNKCLGALEFHHRDPSKKSFSIRRLWDLGYDKVKIEAEKCDLVCANCHREIEEEIFNNIRL